jgi:hypothetical protein
VGYLVYTDAAGKVVHEADTFTCGHCNTVAEVAPKKLASDLGGVHQEKGGYCTRCKKPICERCYQIGTCRPFIEWCEQVEKQCARDAMLRSILG